MYMHVCRQVRVYVSACVCSCVCASIYIYIDVCVGKSLCVHMRTSIYICGYVYMYVFGCLVPDCMCLHV